jgi:hypothetical protein
MENSFQTSFIPKKPITTTAVSSYKSPTSLITVFFVFLLVGMGCVAGGLFFYKIYLQNQEKVLSDSLTAASGSFDKSTVDQLQLFDKRVTVSKQLLASHIVMTPLFTLLGQLTIPSVQFTKFTQNDDDTTGFSVKLSGVAQDYKSIALQADAFNTDQGHSFKDVVFSNLNKDTSGKVLFDISFTVDPSLLSYEKNTSALPTTTTPTSDPSQLTPQTTVAPSVPVTDTTIAPPTTTPSSTATTTSTITPPVPTGSSTTH